MDRGGEAHVKDVWMELSEIEAVLDEVHPKKKHAPLPREACRFTEIWNQLDHKNPDHPYHIPGAMHPFHEPPSSTGSHPTITTSSLNTSSTFSGPDAESTRLETYKPGRHRVQKTTGRFSRQGGVLQTIANSSILKRSFPEWYPNNTNTVTTRTEELVHMATVDGDKENLPPAQSTRRAEVKDTPAKPSYLARRSALRATVQNESDVSSIIFRPTNHAARSVQSKPDNATNIPRPTLKGTARSVRVIDPIEEEQEAIAARSELSPRRQAASSPLPNPTRDDHPTVTITDHVTVTDHIGRSFTLPADGTSYPYLHAMALGDLKPNPVCWKSWNRDHPLFVMPRDHQQRTSDSSPRELGELPRDEDQLLVGLDEVRSNVMQLYAHDEMLQGEVIRRRTAFDMMVKKTNQMKKEGDELKSKNLDLRKEIEARETEVKETRWRLGQEIIELKEKLKAQNDQHHVKLEKYEKIKKQRDDLREEQIKLKTEISVTQKASKGARSQHNEQNRDSLHTQVKALSRENGSLRREKATLSLKVDQLMEDYAFKQEEATSLQAQVVAIKENAAAEIKSARENNAAEVKSLRERMATQLKTMKETSEVQVNKLKQVHTSRLEKVYTMLQERDQDIQELHERYEARDSMDDDTDLSVTDEDNMTSAFIVPDITVQNKEMETIPRPIPVTERVPADDDPTSRPARTPGYALARCIKRVEEEIGTLQTQMDAKVAEYRNMDKAMDNRLFTAMEEGMVAQIKALQEKRKQLYDLHDVLLGQHAVGQEMKEEEVELTIAGIMD